MLFMLKSRHTAETCPAGSISPNVDFLKSVEAQVQSTKVKVVEGYLDAGMHTWWLIVDAESVKQLQAFEVPLFQIGDVETTPVQTFAEAVSMLREAGMQH